MKLRKVVYSYLTSFLSEIFETIVIKENDSFTEKARERHKDGSCFHYEREDPIDKTLLVVLDNHTLGYVLPSVLNTVQIIHTSPSKGSPTSSNLTSSFPITETSNIRLATENDFNEFNVCFDGYKNTNEYEYQK